MPIEPNILLSGTPDQVNLAQAYSEGVKARTDTLGLHAAEQQEQDNQILRQSYMDSGGDLDKAQTLLMQRGASPSAIQALQTQRLATREKYAKLNKEELDLTTARHDQTRGKALSYDGQPDQVKEQQWVPFWQGEVQEGRMTPDEYRQLMTTYPVYPGKDGMTLIANGLATGSQAAKEAMEARNAASGEVRANAAQTDATINQKKWDTTKDAVATETKAKIRQNLAALLGAATTREAYAAILARPEFAEVAGDFPPAERFDPAKTPPAVRRLGMNAEQQTTANQAEQNAAGQAESRAETKRANLSRESIERTNSAIAAGRLAQERTVNGMRYGPGTQEYWVEQLKDNPDSVKEMPPELRSVVGQKFRTATGLPLPTPLNAATQTQETAARNALDGIAFIRQALKNPEIQKNIGPILGRLGEAEQKIGTSARMSPEAERLAQELRTRMRYFVFQEGKAILSGRLPQQLMKKLEDSSAKVSMDPDILEGALAGADNNAQSVMDNADKQRFGGKMRPREMRGQPNGIQPGRDYVRFAKGQNGLRVGQKEDGFWYDTNTGQKIPQ